MEPDYWLELDRNYVPSIAHRRMLFEKHGTDVLSSPHSDTDQALKELMEMALQFLCSRYPRQFVWKRRTRKFYNAILDEWTDLQAVEPLEVLLRHIPEDFAVMIKDRQSGRYHFKAGVVISAQGWNLATKLGMDLETLHRPVPGYERLQLSMDRFFSRCPPEKPIQRGAWSLEIDQPLYMPPGDPHEQLRAVQDARYTIDRVHLRVDWQTLRRLPLSGAMVLNFKTIFTPVPRLRHEPYIPSLLLKILREGDRKIMQYIGTWHVEHIVIPALQAYEDAQTAENTIQKGWEPQTLADSPFFPGWRTRRPEWH